ncbi:hypothetical protein FRB91_000936 [Serendipita sp. 411]|nr:hypothetical protein FRB91_000936 [Serendipita sp. 411]
MVEAVKMVEAKQTVLSTQLRSKKAEKAEKEDETVHNPDLNLDPDPDISILFSRLPDPSTRTNSTKPSGQCRSRRGRKGGGGGKKVDEAEEGGPDGEETRKYKILRAIHVVVRAGHGAGKKGAGCVGIYSKEGSIEAKHMKSLCQPECSRGRGTYVALLTAIGSIRRRQYQKKERNP